MKRFNNIEAHKREGVIMIEEVENKREFVQVKFNIIEVCSFHALLASCVVKILGTSHVISQWELALIVESKGP